MSHVLNVVVAAATVGAMASVGKVDVDSLDIGSVSDAEMNEAYSLIKSPMIKNVIDHNFEQLVNNIHKEQRSLVEIYANANTGLGINGTLQKDLKNGTQNAGGGTSFTSASAQNTAKCHSNCHGNCHGNHNSRGWR